jgi:hypothetical protein
MGISEGVFFEGTEFCASSGAIAQQNRKILADLEKTIDQLQADTLENSRALKEKIDHKALDERLAAAIEPIWESID